jgi:hypothetical protein
MTWQTPSSGSTSQARGRPLPVTLASLVLILLGGLAALGSVIAIAPAIQDVNRNPSGNPLGFGAGEGLTTGVVLIVLGAVVIVTALFLLRGANWARTLGILVAAVPVIAGIWSVLQGQQGLDAAEWTLVLMIYGALIAAGAFVVLALVREGDYFRG